MAARRRNIENWDSESQSESENYENSVIEDDRNHESGKKRRHTPNQIHAMEEFFRDCPHPDEKDRKSLSQSLGLDPSQVKFWFQNKRTQLKAQQKRSENTFLKTQNEKLQAENKNLKEAVNNIVSCRKCDRPFVPGVGGIAHLEKLRAENARLKKELESVQNIAKNIVDTLIWSDLRFTAPSLTPKPLDLDLDLELGGSTFGAQLYNNTGDRFIFGTNLQFNVAHFASSAFDEQMIFQPKMEGAFRTPTFTDDYVKAKRPRHF